MERRAFALVKPGRAAQPRLLISGEPTDDVRHQLPVERPSQKILREPVRADVGRPGNGAAATMVANGKKRPIRPAMVAGREKSRRTVVPEIQLVHAEDRRPGSLYSGKYRMGRLH